jgi:SAM-dependent methyltransferase
MNCRFCGTQLHQKFIDLVNAPPSNSFLNHEQLNEPEMFYPLKLFVCENCFLVQIDEYKKSSEIFDEKYAYFSSFSKSWLDHSRIYANMAENRFGLSKNNQVIEIACNDGYLLQYFQEKGIPALGIEPAKNVAEAARGKGIEIIEDFFGTRLAKDLAKKGRQADLLVGNNVLAHVPDINDFVAGLKLILKQTGVITMEFPHLMKLIDGKQFDTIYHEHFSYFSLYTVERIFSSHGLRIFDVEELTTHGGSLRIYAGHEECLHNDMSENMERVLKKENYAGMQDLRYYQNFQDDIDKVKYELLSFLIEQKKRGKKVAAYGAAAKGNTLLNYCGIKQDLISFVADASPFKQGKYLPGSHIPVFSEEAIKDEKPDFILILPWNIADEIIYQLSYVRKWNSKFIIPIPCIKAIENYF